MDTLLMGPIAAENPILVEGVLQAGRDVNCIGRFVAGIDQRARPTVSRPRQAAWITRIHTARRWLIDRLKRSHPPVLSKIVIEKTEAGAQDRVPRFRQPVGDSQPRSKRRAVIMRH